MREILKEQLIEYEQKLDANKEECFALMKKGEKWEDKAKEAAGLKLLMEACILELKKYTK